ncbi:MAG TPA: malonic semialdehyde reductase [Candidatus Binataceae bacterium]|nr:malonic semialdehyde reductase [Candidatus Binataceae bacterium]
MLRANPNHDLRADARIMLLGQIIGHGRASLVIGRKRLDDHGLDQIFREARTHIAWLDVPVSDELLREAVELAKMGPTSANCMAMRIVFVRSKAAKERLRPALVPGNVEKTMAAPATAIVGYDLEFHDALPRLFPRSDMRKVFVDKPDLIKETAFRNSSLQGAYFLLALRSLGLDIGPMSGFDNAKVDAEFFSGTSVKSNFLVNIGHGDPTKLFPRGPRLSFEEIARIL